MKDDLRLSHSSAQELRGCEMRWYLRKAKQQKPDKDYKESDGLSVGKAFHYIQEKSKHVKTKLGPLLNECLEHNDINLSREHVGLVAAMCNVYWEYQAQCKLDVVGIEYEIESKYVSGYVDLISSDDKGNWYIEDLKCYRSFGPWVVTGLASSPQLNLYSNFRVAMAKKYKLDPNKFAGAGYRVITKPSSKRKKDEPFKDYVDRLAKSVRVYRYIVPSKELQIMPTVETHDHLRTKMLDILNGSEQPTRNFSNCMNYFSPCPYWSHCHGKTHSECAQEANERLETFEV